MRGIVVACCESERLSENIGDLYFLESARLFGFVTVNAIRDFEMMFWAIRNVSFDSDCMLGFVVIKAIA
jgi:hypothetical protein